MKRRVWDQEKKKLKKTKEKLINLANKIICEKGIDDTSIKDITKDAGALKGTFYTYFKSKYDIVKEIIDKFKKEVDEDFLKKNLEEKIKLYNKYLQERIASSGIEVCRCFIKNNLKNDTYLNIDLDNIKKKLNSSKDEIKDIDIDKYSEFIVNLNYGQMLHWCMSNGKYNLLDNIDNTTNIILTSLKKEGK